MERLKKRLTKHNALENALSDRDTDAREEELADDTDAFTSSNESRREVDMTLKLKLSESCNSVVQYDELGRDELGGDLTISEADNDCLMHGQTVFEIISTDTLKDGHSNYVVYRILLTKSSVVDPNPVIIDRRYTDFQELHDNLQKYFSELMIHIVFPKKRLFRNFTPKTIAERSRAFEQYLTHLYSLDQIRFSGTFLDFFFLPDKKEAYHSMLDVEYEKAIASFQKVLLIQEKVLGYLNCMIGETLCALVACCQIIEDDDMGLKYAKKALKCYAKYEDNSFYLPLLQSYVHLCWKTGSDKEKYEEKLNSRKDSKDVPSLLSMVHSSVVL